MPWRCPSLPSLTTFITMLASSIVRVGATAPEPPLALEQAALRPQLDSDDTTVSAGARLTGALTDRSHGRAGAQRTGALEARPLR